ncbi:MAG: transcriptional coactivator p15/PC4 family protein [Acidobacteria bacterium]|nr:transcriptional coactivator p15/PC4 family protein [Acidobacteriota bacterium]
MSEPVAEMEKGPNEKIFFSLSEYKGKKYADIRVYFENDESEWKPTRKGLTISLDRFAEFKEHVGTLEKFLTTQGHLPVDQE